MCVNMPNQSISRAGGGGVVAYPELSGFLTYAAGKWVM